MAAKIKKGDRVVVIDRQGQGQDRAMCCGFSRRKPRHRPGCEHGKAPPAPDRAAEGGIISKEMPIHMSNLAHQDPKDGKPTRVGFKTLNDGRKVRFAKRSGEVIDG